MDADAEINIEAVDAWRPFEEVVSRRHRADRVILMHLWMSEHGDDVHALERQHGRPSRGKGCTHALGDLRNRSRDRLRVGSRTVRATDRKIDGENAHDLASWFDGYPLFCRRFGADT